MTDRSGGLPVQFAMLEPLCEHWDLPDYAARNARRQTSDMAELADVHRSLLTHGPAVLAYLDTREFGRLDAQDARLARLMLALPVLGMAVEVFGMTRVPDTDGLEMRVTGEPAL